jgi:hypothetical protein
MRSTLVLGLASAVAVAGVMLVPSAAVTRAEDAPKYAEKGSIQSSIVRTYAKERFLEVKVERVLAATPAQAGEKKIEAATPEDAMRVGEIIFVDASACSRVIDEKGIEKKRDDKTAWFTKDEGWAILKPGQRVRIDYNGAREVPAPKAFPEGARSGGKLLVYTATLIELLPESGVPATVTPATGIAEGAIVRLFAAEKLIELKVEATDVTKASKEKDAAKGSPPVGTLILLRLENATVVDEKGVERKRDDKTAWFAKDDGWSVLKAGVRVKVVYSGTQQVAAPADFPKEARAGGTVLVHTVTIVHLLADAK